MMKFPVVYTCFFVSLCFVLLQSNRTGRATNGDEGVTGAPGDTFFGNQPKTCGSCHQGGTYNPTASLVLLKANGDTAKTYVPGTRYTARLRVLAASGNPAGYGFQMIAIRDANKTELKGFSDTPGANNRYKLKTISNGRTYAEQETMSVPNFFDMEWTAPQKGTGNVTFYFSANAVNNLQGNSGDSATNNNLTVEEAESASSEDAVNTPAKALKVSPNPVATQNAVLQFDLLESGKATLSIRANDGRTLWQTSSELSLGQQYWELPTADFQPGVYFVQLRQNNKAISTKMIKM